MITKAEFITKELFNTKYVVEIIKIYKTRTKTQGLTQYNEILKPERHLKKYRDNILVII
jgi:hypothetical protein